MTPRQAECAQLYRSGESIRVIGKRLGISFQRVSQLLQSARVPTRPLWKVGDHQIDRIERYYASGLSATDVARRVKMPVGTVLTILHKIGVSLRPASFYTTTYREQCPRAATLYDMGFSSTELSRILGCSQAHAHRLARVGGATMRPRGSGGRPAPDITKSRAIDLLSRGATVAEVSVALRVAHSTVRRWRDAA
jgi:transposase-like protein